MTSQNFIFKPNADQGPLAHFVIRQSSAECLADIRTVALEYYLPALTGDVSFTGYEEGGRDKVWVQIESIYNALLKTNLRYTLEPTHKYNAPISQTVRQVSEVLGGAEGTCIDSVVLMASLVLQIGLNPLVVIIGNPSTNTATHAILGVWMEKRTGNTVKISAGEITNNVADIGLCETIGLLQQPALTFNQAFSGTTAYLVESKRGELTLPAGVETPDSTVFDVPSDIGILYGVDIRKAMMDYTLGLPVISIMGAKGGVGKTICTARMAELIAETGKNVLLLDFDIENRGSTVFHKERTPYGLPAVQTVYEHLALHAKGLKWRKWRSSEGDRNLGLWDVTPPYLSDNVLGRVYMIPARSEDDINAFQVVANIDYKQRNRILSAVVSEIIERAGLAQDVGCVIIDCGAGTNPLFSAAMNNARYKIVVASPEDVCIQQWNTIRAQLKADFPQMDMQNIHLLLNRVHSELDVLKWKAHRPVGYVEESSDLSEGYYRNAVYFDLGYDSFSMDVREALAGVMEQQHQNLVPSEYDVWMAPWVDILKQQFPRRLLSEPKFRRKGFIAKALMIVGLLCLLAGGLFFYRSLKKDWFAEIKLSVTLESEPSIETLTGKLRNKIEYKEDTRVLEITGPLSENESDTIIGICQNHEDRKKLEQHLREISSKEASTLMTLVRLLLFLLCLVLLVLLAGSIYFYVLMSRRKAFLKGLAGLDPIDAKAVYEFLKPILHPRTRIGESEPRHKRKKILLCIMPNKQTMSWLYNILDKEIKESRERILRERISTRPADHL